MHSSEAIKQATRLLERAEELDALKYGEFTLASGKSSRFYFDGRLISMDPESVSIVSDLFLDIMANRGMKIFGGPAVGAVPMVGAVALRAHQRGEQLTGYFVRSEQKQHGMGKLIEGNISAGDSVAVYDDTISTGGSLLDAVEAVQELPANVELALCILDRKQGGTDHLQKLGVPVFNILIRTPSDTVEVDQAALQNWFG